MNRKSLLICGTGISLTLGLVLLLGSVVWVQAAPGDLDPTFGTWGRATTAFEEAVTSSGYGVAVQADGKMVLVGTAEGSYTDGFGIVRLNPNGTQDPSFSDDGMTITQFPADQARANVVTIQPDGRILAAGWAAPNIDNQDFALARYYTDGSLDPSFGNGGKVMTNMGDVSDEIKSITVLPDGKIVAIGISSFYTFALARYNPDGNLDTSFGNGGKVFTYFGSNRVASLGGAVQPDGKIIVAGEVNINSGWDFALARYNTNGSLDTSFGTSGKVTTDILLNDAAYAVVVQPDGKIVVGGYAGSSPDVHADFGLARYNSNGSLDTSYGTGGKVITDFVGNSDFIQSMQLQPDGKIVAAGYTQAQPHVQYALARYDSTGALDSTFGTGGKSPPIWAGPPQVRR